ncbi:MAG: hypothetical protein ACLGGX_07265 [Bdellovibrionia bacterium]
MFKFFLISAGFLSLFSWSSHAQLEVPAQWNHQVLHTENFEIVFNAEQRSLAEIYAQKLEVAHQLLKPHFKYFPSKTLVILNDKTDQTNGYATRIPYPHIMIYPVLPGPQESLGEYGDWILELLVHEYVHILNFEPAEGIPGFLRSIFGSILSPNLLLPQWWKEGLAVHFETKLSSGGRLRSTYQDAMLRSFVLESSLFNFDIAEINEAPPTWPRGMRPYLFGSVFWAHALQYKNDEVADELNRAHSRRMPYFIEAPATRYLGTSYENFYHQALSSLHQKVEAQIKILKTVTTSDGIPNQWQLKYTSLPSIHPKGHLMAFVGVDRKDKRSLKIFRKESQQTFFEGQEIRDIADEDKNLHGIKKQDQEAPPTGNISRASWFHDKNILVYDKIDFVNRIERYSDLYTYDVDNKKTDRLTFGLRAREASVSLDDKHIVYVKISSGQTELCEFEISTKQHQCFIKSQIGERISLPIYKSQQEIIYSLRRTQQGEALYIFNKDSKQAKELTLLGHSNFHATIDKENLYFLSATSGTYNVLATDLNELENPEQVLAKTHSLTSVLGYAFDATNGDLYYTEMTSHGPQIKLLPKASLLSLEQEGLPQVVPLYKEAYPTPEPISSLDSSVIKQEEDYNGLSYLLPRYWIPFLTTSSSTGGLVLEASTSGHDPLKKHTYAGTLSYDSLLGKTSINAQYINNSTNTPIGFATAESYSYLGNFENIITDRAHQLSVLPDTWRLVRDSALEVGWKYNERSFFDFEVKRNGPFVFLRWNNLSLGGDQISPEEGWATYVAATRYLPENEFLDHHQYQAGVTAYTSKWLPKRHAMMARLNLFHIPEKISDIYGAQSDAYTMDSNSPLPQYLLRGYNTGEFFGRSLASVNLEYRFPVTDIYRGSGTDPYFIKNIWAAVVVDGLSLEGRAASLEKGIYYPVTMNRQFWNYGGEAHLTTTLGYMFPISFVFGLYSAPDGVDGERLSSRFSLQISGF